MPSQQPQQTRGQTPWGSVKYLKNKELSERISKQFTNHRRSSSEPGPARQALPQLGRAAIQRHLGSTGGRNGSRGARCHSRTDPPRPPAEEGLPRVAALGKDDRDRAARGTGSGTPAWPLQAAAAFALLLTWSPRRPP